MNNRIRRAGFLRYNLTMFFMRGRFAIICFVEAILLLLLVDGIGGNEWLYGERVGIFEIFPVLELNVYTLLIITAGWLLMVCDIPFQREGNALYLVRTTKKRWCKEQVLSLGICGRCYLFIIYFISVLVSLPHISISNQWSILCRRSAVQNGLLGIDGINVPKGILKLSPMAATGYAFGLAFLLLLFLGLFCLVFNCYAKRFLGLFLAFLLVACDSIVDLMGTKNLPQIASYTSPLTLARALANYSPYVTGYASVGMAFCILFLGCVVLWIMFQRSSRRMEW